MDDGGHIMKGWGFDFGGKASVLAGTVTYLVGRMDKLAGTVTYLAGKLLAKEMVGSETIL
jgi:hypothetical protein